MEYSVVEGETVQLRIVLSNTSSSVVTVMLNSQNMTINGKDILQNSGSIVQKSDSISHSILHSVFHINFAVSDAD